MKATVVRLPPELHERLRTAAFERRTSMQAISLEAIARELERGVRSPERPTTPTSRPRSLQGPETGDLVSALASLVTDQSVAGAFLQAFPFPIVVKDRDSRVVWCNRQFEILADGTLDELRGLTSAEIFDLPDGDPLSDAERRVVATGKCQESTQIIDRERLRRTLRFGICDASGAVHQIGVVAFEFSLALQPAPTTSINPSDSAGVASQSRDQAITLEERRKLRAL